MVLATFYKMACKWPIWLQVNMMRATLSGLPQGLSYGCALGTIVGVEAGFSHTVADMTCTQVLLLPHLPTRVFTILYMHLHVDLEFLTVSGADCHAKTFISASLRVALRHVACCAV